MSLSKLEAQLAQYEAVSAEERERLFPDGDIPDIISRVILVNPDGSVILNRRPLRSKQAPSKLQISGGKFKVTDQSRKFAAIREIYEEFGIRLSARDLYFLQAEENGNYLSFFFLAMLTETYEANQQPNHLEFDEFQVIPRGEIQSYIDAGEIAFDHPTILNQYLQLVS